MSLSSHYTFAELRLFGKDEDLYGYPHTDVEDTHNAAEWKHKLLTSLDCFVAGTEDSEGKDEEKRAQDTHAHIGRKSYFSCPVFAHRL